MSNTNRNRQRGKAHQKRVAKALDALDVGTLGGEDVHDYRFSIECKSRKKFVGEAWFEQADANNKRKHKGIPSIVIVHITGKRIDNDIVMIRMNDFKGLLNVPEK